jgi:hypothetical protein
MKINRVFVINQDEYNFLLILKNFIKFLIKWYELFLIKFKNIKYREKKINFKFNNIYIVTSEKLKDYDFTISKISQIYYPDKLISPINHNQSLCSGFQIEISNGGEIYNQSAIHINFDLYIKSFKIKKIKNYNFFLEKNDLKNIIKTKKWLKINIRLRKPINLKKNKIFIKIKKINFDNSKKNRKSFVSFSTIKKTNVDSPKIIFIVLDGISNKDFINYSEKISQTKVFKNLIKDSLFYKNTITPSTVTGASMPSLLTNTNLLQHGLFIYDSFLFKGSQFPSKKLQFLSEKFLEQGYKTTGLTNFSRMRPHFGMNIGFHNYTNICSNNFHTSPYFEKALQILKLSENEKSFIFFHYIGGHPPFNPEIHFNNKKENVDEKYFYYSNISQSEFFIETIVNYLKQRKLYEKTTLIITSDHGKTLHDFNKLNYHFNEDRLNVPLIYKPRKKKKVKIIKVVQEKRTLVQKEIYKLLNKFENINLNNSCQIKQDNQILWTTISPDYREKKYFNFIGYGKLYKWVFKCDLEYKKFNKLNIIGTPKVYKIVNLNYIDENKDLYSLLDVETIKKTELSLHNFIINSNKKIFKPEKQFNNYINISF